MENFNASNQEQNIETANEPKKEEIKEKFSENWIINNWIGSNDVFDFEIKAFQDIFHLSVKNEVEGEFELSIELKNSSQSNQFFFTIRIQNKDNQNSLSQSKTISFKPESSIEKITLPIYYNQITEENGFITPDGCLDLLIEIINLRKPSNHPLIMPIINSIQQQLQSPAVKTSPPYSGLKNQGSTCYMNSILQSLYHIPLFKSIIYSLDTIKNDTSDEKNIPLNLQRLFGLMQLTHGPCSTYDLTKSFGWDAQETFRQNDAQEFCRQFLDNLEMKMKGTSLEDAIPSLFKGKILVGIRCRNVPFQSLKEEDFYDISLDVKDSSTLEESFEKTIENDPLVGENQYDAGSEFGMQDADMTAEYVEFPRVLHLHLRRFMFDPNVNNYVKINKKFTYPEIIDLAPYMSKQDKNEEGKENHMFYELFGVLVHWGTIIGGHYYAYIKTTKERKWFEFNDTKVTEVAPEIAIEGNFGGPDQNLQINTDQNADPTNTVQPPDKLYSAYMLIYVKQDAIDEVFKEVSNEEVPDHVVRYMHQKEEEEKAYAQAQYEKENTINTPIVTDDVIEIFAQNNELKISVPYGYDESTFYTPFEIKKYDSFRTVYEKCARIISKRLGSFILFSIAREKIDRALPIIEDSVISILNPLPTGFLLRMRNITANNDASVNQNEEIRVERRSSDIENEINNNNDENVDGNSNGDDGEDSYGNVDDIDTDDERANTKIDAKNPNIKVGNDEEEQSIIIEVENTNKSDSNDNDDHDDKPIKEKIGGRAVISSNNNENEEVEDENNNNEEDNDDVDNANKSVTQTENFDENENDHTEIHDQSNISTTIDNNDQDEDESDDYPPIDLNFSEEESNLLFVLSYFRSIKRCPIHFVFTKEVHSTYTLTNLCDEFRMYFKLSPECKLAIFRATNAYQVEPFNIDDLNILVKHDSGPFLIIQPIEEYVNSPCCYNYRDLTIPNYDEEEDDDEYVSYVNSFMKENPYSVNQYMTCHYNTAQLSIQTINGHKILIVPYIISFFELKLFASEAFQLDYNDQYDCMLIFPHNRHNFIRSADGNDQSLFIAEIVNNLNSIDNNNSNRNQQDQLSFKLFVIKDTSIDCFMDMALFEVINSLSSSYNSIPQILPKTITYTEAVDCFQKMYNLNEPLRLVAIVNRRVYWLNGPGLLLDVNSPIKLEIIPESQRDLDPSDLLIPVLQFKIACYSFLSEKSAFNHLDDGDPYLFKVVKDEKFAVTKERLLDERKIPSEIHKNLQFFLLNPNAEVKEYILMDDDVITDLALQGASIYFGPTNSFSTTYRIQKESAIKIYN